MCVCLCVYSSCCPAVLEVEPFADFSTKALPPKSARRNSLSECLEHRTHSFSDRKSSPSSTYSFTFAAHNSVLTTTYNFLFCSLHAGELHTFNVTLWPLTGCLELNSALRKKHTSCNSDLHSGGGQIKNKSKNLQPC